MVGRSPVGATGQAGDARTALLQLISVAAPAALTGAPLLDLCAQKA